MKFKDLALIAGLILAGVVAYPFMMEQIKPSAPLPLLTIVPVLDGPSCRAQTAHMYDECAAQDELFAQAQALARAEGKTLLVAYGAEWCIWCHVFHAYVRGESGRFTHSYSDSDDEQRFRATLLEKGDITAGKQAHALATYVAENFVLVNLEGRYSEGAEQVLQATGANAHRGYGIPFIFTVDADGRYAAHLNSDRVSIRRDTVDWFRGYDRDRLTKDLERLRQAAL